MGNNNEKLIQSISEVFSNKEILHYRIPNYQRGYKWSADNVVKLLSDLHNFEEAHKGKTEGFYCLQNITLLPCSEDGKEVNVVDGQQRLTTLYILLSFLKHNRPDDSLLSFFTRTDCLCYDVREKTADFLKEQIFTGLIWQSEEIRPNDAKSKDMYYIMDVAAAIKNWFTKNDLETKTVTENLKLIINNISDIKSNDREEETALFSGLNGGKVDLDGADLVRAILITRSSKEKYQNETNSESSMVMAFRQRIARELDEMNLWWNGNEQRTYFEQFLSNTSDKNRVFDHKEYPLSLLYKLFYEVYKDVNDNIDKFGIEFFENGLDINKATGDDNWELYNEVMKFHITLKYWFEDRQLYHWIGLLIFGYKELVNLKTIWDKWMEFPTKNEFLYWIVTFIQENLKQKDESKEEFIGRIKNVKTNWYGDNQRDITRLLVLMDVMVCTGFYENAFDKQEIVKEVKSFYKTKDCGQRLKANYFHKQSEDYEHIRSCTPNENEGKETRQKMEWINHIKKIYGELNETSDELVCMLYDKIGSCPDEYLEDNLILEVNDLMNQYGQNSIGNLVLLDSGVNRGYKNACFQDKIQRIFNEYINGDKYIRPYTMIVFERKIKDSDKVWRWTQYNINENVNNIANNVELFYSIRK